MINFNDVLKKKTEKKNMFLIGHRILDHPSRILIIGSSGSEKTNSLFNIINQ